MLIYRTYYRCIECKELKVLVRCLARRKKINSSISLHRPVAMLAASVDSVKRFLVENNFKMVFLSHFRHKNHQEHVLVDGLGSFTEYRSTLELVRCHFVMSCLKLNSKLICLCFKIFHECFHTPRNGSEIVV